MLLTSDKFRFDPERSTFWGETDLLRIDALPESFDLKSSKTGKVVSFTLEADHGTLRRYRDTNQRFLAVIEFPGPLLSDR